MVEDKMASKPAVELPLDPEEAVEKADLHYVGDQEAGYRRKRWGRGFTYLDENGDHIRDSKQRKRFKELSIPPAWTDVWICTDPSGHIQATGRDDEGRKQYIYHPRWEEVRQRTKFEKLIPFAQLLPTLRAQIDKDLRRHHFPRAKVVALTVSLLDETLIRVGNAEYAESNGSHGLTTMHDAHVRANGSKARFNFMGKGGKEHEVSIRNRRLVRHLRKCKRLPGRDLFQYEDGNGGYRPVTSADVNYYLAEHMHEAFSAKDFRTWGATLLAAQSLVRQDGQADNRPTEDVVADAIVEVAQALGNTATIARDYYVHPAVIRAYEEGELQSVWEKEPAEPATGEGLSADEARVLAILCRYSDDF